MSTTLKNIIADFRTSLSAKISVGDTSGSLSSIVDDDGVNLPAGKYCFTLDGDNAQKEHIVCDLSGSSMSNIQSVSRQGALTTGVAREHRVGATVTITDFSHILLINNILKGSAGLDSDNPLYYDVHPTFSDDKELVDKKYVDDIAIGGGVDASDALKGITKLSVAPASSTNPIAVGDNDGRVPTQGENDALVGTSGTPSSSNKYVTNDDTSATSSANKVVRAGAGGKIAEGFLQMTDAQATDLTDGGVTTLHSHNPSSIGQQSVAIYAGTTTTLASTLRMTSNATGTVLYAVQLLSTSSIQIQRLEQDASTGLISVTHTTTITGLSINVTVNGVALVGSYIYVAFTTNSGGTYAVRRYDAADLTNVTSMTFSGTNWGATSGLWSDGTFLYAQKDADEYYKYSISGTTISDSATITYTSKLGTDDGAVSDGTSVWFSRLNGNALTVYKYPVAGGAASATAINKVIYPDSYPNKSAIQLVILKTGFLGFGWGYSIESNSAMTGAAVLINPITAN